MSDEEGQGVPEAQEKEEEPKFFLDVILSRQINMKKVPQERAAKQVVEQLGGRGSRVDKDGGLQGKVGGGAGDIGKSAARSGDDDDDSGEDGEVPARRLFE